MEIIDAWAQHPTPRHSNDEIFASLRRWNRREVAQEQTQLPVSVTIGAMDQGAVRPVSALLVGEAPAAPGTRSMPHALATSARSVPVASLRQAERRFPPLRAEPPNFHLRDLPWSIRRVTRIETRRSTMSNKMFTLTVPVTFKKDGKDQTSFRRVGAVFENTRENGETVLSIKLDFPVAVTELVAFPSKADGDDGQVTE